MDNTASLSYSENTFFLPDDYEEQNLRQQTLVLSCTTRP